MNYSLSISGTLYQAAGKQRVEMSNTRDSVGRQKMTCHLNQISVLSLKHWELRRAKVTTKHLQTQCPTGGKFDSQTSSKIQKRKEPAGFSKLLRSVETACQSDDLFPFHRLSQQGVCSMLLSEAAGQSPLQQGLDGVRHQPGQIFFQPAMRQDQPKLGLRLPKSQLIN